MSKTVARNSKPALAKLLKKALNDISEILNMEVSSVRLKCTKNFWNRDNVSVRMQTQCTDVTAALKEVWSTSWEWFEAVSTESKLQQSDGLERVPAKSKNRVVKVSVELKTGLIRISRGAPQKILKCAGMSDNLVSSILEISATKLVWWSSCSKQPSASSVYVDSRGGASWSNLFFHKLMFYV